MPNDIYISAAVEGDLDEAVIRRLISDAGACTANVFGKRGKPFLREKLSAYNHAAERNPWIVLVDLDHDGDCAPEMKNDWLPAPSGNMYFRIAVREIEAWLLADCESLATFLRVNRHLVPTTPEHVDNPKQDMVNLARLSRSRDVRDDMVPRARSGREIGPAYTSRLIEFVASSWRPTVAAARARSLRGAIQSLAMIADT